MTYVPADDGIISYM